MSQEGLLIMKKSKPKKSKNKLTKAQLNKWRKETNACEHDKIGYQALMNLANGMFARSKQDAEDMHKVFGILDWQKDHINQLKKMNELLVDKYEDRLEEIEKSNKSYVEANTQLTLNVNELKERLFGKFEMRLKNLALRPSKKKDN